MTLLENELESYPMGAIIVNVEGIIEYANEKVCKLFKYEKEELLESNVNMLVPEYVRARHNELVYKFFEDESNITTGFDRILDGVNKYDKVSKYDINLTMRKIDCQGVTHKFAVA